MVYPGMPIVPQAGPGTAEQRIRLQRFSSRISDPDEDWSGIADRKVRRRLQNRCNQRALRLRKKLESKTSPDATVPNRRDAQAQGAQAMATAAPLDLDLDLNLDQVRILAANTPQAKAILAHFEALARAQYTQSSPRADMLLHLIKFNFIKALLANMAVLGLSDEHLHDEAISPFNTLGPWHAASNMAGDSWSNLPPSLRATPIQRAVPHHPWLDLLPIPQMRDNLILAGESYDEETLCRDMKGHGCAGASAGGRRGGAYAGHSGIIVWKDPWDASGWEVTEGFARSWGWVVRGCWDLMASTNAWRARRCERALF
ncbi:uncharacterized protein DSM5745_09292 [Aspergillus mulundensis]|uniref:BZIP domain-containing protein n=1 Tax=Aspergillus mulundensis TaxID=1810919 RepID=A0A3D8R057_9EURO|nr:hypothetical protein DSM5745_09292 [Aspergillus mulundensis]RDW67426.1 hypothetical protein DSM5745_09292 [Aspergillus mulundensis]